jgi:hypothetical protein
MLTSGLNVRHEYHEVDINIGAFGAKKGRERDDALGVSSCGVRA